MGVGEEGNMLQTGGEEKEKGIRKSGYIFDVAGQVFQVGEQEAAWRVGYE